MSVQEVMQQVSYVTSPSGKPTAVQVQIEVWQEIVALLEQTMTAQTEPDEEDAAWEIFLSLANDAQPGTLDNPSTNHNAYLYGLDHTRPNQKEIAQTNNRGGFV